jgi:hypothetical protein
VRLDQLPLFFGGRLSVAKGLRRVGCQLFLDDLHVGFAGLHELAELRMRARCEQQVRWRVHQRLGLHEKIDGIFETPFVEGLRALGGQRASAGALLVTLGEGGARGTQQTHAQHNPSDERTRPK